MNLRRLSLALPLLAVATFAVAVVYAATTTLLVYPGHLEGWQTRTTPGTQPSPAATPSVSFVFGPSPAPFGRGSVELRVGSDGEAAAELHHFAYTDTVLPTPTPTPDGELPPPQLAPNELSALGYYTYVQQDGSGGQAPYIILHVDYDNNGGADDLLFFEPAYQSATFCPSNPQATLAVGTWQSWNALNGCWWSQNGTAGATPGAGVMPLRLIAATQPGARIVNRINGGGVRLVAGFGAGTWANFVGNADGFDIGVGGDSEGDPNTTRYDFEPSAPPAASATGVIISEFRTSGPGASVASIAAKKSGAPRGRVNAASARAGGTRGLPLDGGGTNAPPCCDGDDFVELYNTSDADISVASSDGSGGWSLVKRGATCIADPVVVAVIPNGTFIPARGHYLLAGDEYSLSGYAAGNGTTATPDQLLGADLEDDNNFGLFNTTDTSNFNTETRMDAVGFDAGSGTTCDLLTEGAKLPAPRGSTDEHSFVRKMTSATGGTPQDTDNNAADFVTVTTTPAGGLGDNPTPVLGAPGPENTTSPVTRGDIGVMPIAPSLPASAAPNRERLAADVGPCSDFGTLIIRRTFTNNTGASVTRLRFRVVDLTTLNTLGYENEEQADLRVRDSLDETVAVPGRGTVSVLGLAHEQPPSQPPPDCGGLNASLSLDQITLGTPLAPGASVDVAFRLGVMRSGRFRFFFNVEALTGDAGPPTERPVGRRGR